MASRGSARDAFVVSVLVAVLALVVGCAAAPPPEAVGAPQRVELTYVGGSVQGGVSRTPIGLGRPVQLVVHSDVADEIHVHGYDLKGTVAAGGTGTVEFVADQAGVFEVELESRGAQIAQLEVR
jgi:hypothetical protein